MAAEGRGHVLGWRPYVLAACLALLAAAVFGKELRFFRAQDPRVLLEVRDDIRTVEDLSQWPQGHGAFENAGFVSCATDAWAESGWCLPAGQAGSLRYVLPDVPGGRSALMRLFFFRRDTRASSRLAILREGDPTPRFILENPHLADARLDLSSALAGPGGRLIVQFEGENPTDHPDVIVQYFEIRVFAEPLPTVPSVWRMTLAFLALGLCMLPIVPWRTWVPPLGILSVGFALRYAALLRVLWLPLDWDAVGFYQLSRKMRLFTETGFFSADFGVREPLFPFVIKGVLAVLGDAETHVRLVSGLASLVIIWQVHRVARRLFSARMALVGAAMMAMCLPLVRESARGLRVEVEIILLLGLVEAGLLARGPSMWRRGAVCGCLAGALSLLRVNYLLTVPLVLLAVFARPHRRMLCAGGLALVLMIGLQLPHRVNGWRRHGDWSWDSSARWFANNEFAGRSNWPTRLELWRNAGQGPPMRPLEYFFTLHTVPELAVGHIRGMWKLIRHMEVIAFHRGLARLTGVNLKWVDALFQLGGVAGLGLAAVTRGWRWLPITFFALLLHLPFLYDRSLVEPWRHTYHAFPFFVLSALATLSVVGDRLRVWPLRPRTQGAPGKPWGLHIRACSLHEFR